MRNFSCLLCILFLAVAGAARAQDDPVNWVNEIIGTAHEGQTFPITGMPFAMTQWTPQTRGGSLKCVAPYYFADHRIQGFRGTHFLSGSCAKDYGSITLMPLSGALKLGEEERASAFDRSSESMKPDRYAVTLSDFGIAAEITGTTRAGFMRFRYDRSGKPWILVQANSAPGDGEVYIDPVHNEITVVNPVRRQYAGAGKLAGFSEYAVVQFDHPFHAGGVWSGALKNDGALNQDGIQGSPGAYVWFDLKTGEAVQARIGTSFTSLDEARRNLQTEIPGWDFNNVASAAHTAWKTALNEIAVRGDATRRRIFYTALYHTMLLPRVFSDVDGSYPGFAAEGRTETAQDFTYYCDFSLWDTFRAVHPLFTLLDPDRERDMVQSLIAEGEQGGFLPIFPAWNSYTAEMTGDHADAVIADAYVKGIRGFDIEQAYRLMRKNATELPSSHEAYADGRGRRALASYLQYGYIPLEDPVRDAFHLNEQVSRTLDYAFDDFEVGEIAQALGHTQDAELFHRRAQKYRNVIDPTTGFARGRYADGSWINPFHPSEKASYITEGLPSQFTFFVLHDIPGLIALLGGREAFVSKLDTLFAHGEYDQSNEPSHHIAYLYDYAGAAWKTQQHVRAVLDSQYADTPSGLPGNDDAGQTSAWFIFSALGFYPVTPGVPAYQIGSPLFDEATLSLPGGKKFHIVAEGASADKPYIQSALLNGKPLTRPWLQHSELTAGGELVFTMSAQPSTLWSGK